MIISIGLKWSRLYAILSTSSLVLLSIPFQFFYSCCTANLIVAFSKLHLHSEKNTKFERSEMIHVVSSLIIYIINVFPIQSI